LRNASPITGSSLASARRFVPVLALTVIFGFDYTVFSEWLNVAVRKSCEYSELMPVISVGNLRLGASPLLQWIVVPTVASCVARRAGVAQRAHSQATEG
jgi:hypothetical protein